MPRPNLREGWEDKPVSRKYYPEHPRFQEILRENLKLIHWVDKRLRRRFSYITEIYWPSGYFEGFIIEVLNRMLYTWTPAKGTLSNYLNRLCQRHVVEDFLQYESESWHQFLDKTTIAPDDKHQTDVNYNYHEIAFYLYRVPEEDVTWTQEILDYFENGQEAWDFFTGDLREREKTILMRMFIHKNTQEEIAFDEKISKQRVNQIKFQALENIRIKIRETENLRDYFKIINQPVPELGFRKRKKWPTKRTVKI